MTSFDDELRIALETIRQRGLFRELRRVDSAQGPRLRLGGQTLLNFSSNDYLGLAEHPALKQAAIRAVQTFGTGAGASRLVCGSLAPFHELEEALAAFKKTEAALTFSTGYATALGTMGALLGREDVVVLDRLVHASIVDAAKLCGAQIRVFTHNDLNDLEDKLKWAVRRKASAPASKSRVLIVTESVFSMDGDTAPLREIVALKEQYGAWLMLDEAHATGVFGLGGRGLAEELGVSGQIEIQMGTLGKALGASGGFICGSRALVELLVNRARSFIFSTAPVPAAAAAAAAAVGLVQSPEGELRRSLLRERIRQLNRQLGISKAGLAGAIVPIILGAEDRAVEAAAQLRERGFFVPAIRFPAVARGAARLRLTVTAAHSAEEVTRLVHALEEIVEPSREKVGGK
ncbi:MAG TPA: 8-amino-7-oxononanoate synthase [Verrucomicrobiae bacterium]|nr:8-amino-7-oxononanoate synthase [Verrucomicrobiae bacterium]